MPYTEVLLVGVLSKASTEDETEVTLEETNHTIDEGGGNGNGQPFEELENEGGNVLEYRILLFYVFFMEPFLYMRQETR